MNHRESNVRTEQGSRVTDRGLGVGSGETNFVQYYQVMTNAGFYTFHCEKQYTCGQNPGPAEGLIDFIDPMGDWSC